MIPCTVNGLPLRFIFDTGASDVMLSLTEAIFMLKNDYISESDFTGTERYQVANGEIEEGYTLLLRRIEIGGEFLTNVKASIIMKADAPLLLGQSALSQLGAFHFDYAQNVLTIGGGGAISTGSMFLPAYDSTVERITFPSGAIYVGQILDGKRHGQGTMTYPDGEKYVGQHKSGKSHGQGTSTWANGEKYTGDYVNDMFHGQGTYVFSDGKRYIGDFENNINHGHGTMTFPNGDKYTGGFMNGMFHGQGTFTYANGNKFVGEYKYDKRSGQGTMTGPDADYIGEWKDGAPHGQGAWYSPGFNYIGGWKDGAMHGQGTLKMANGESHTGKFENGRPVR